MKQFQLNGLIDYGTNFIIDNYTYFLSVGNLFYKNSIDDLKEKYNSEFFKNKSLALVYTDMQYILNSVIEKEETVSIYELKIHGVSFVPNTFIRCIPISKNIHNIVVDKHIVADKIYNMEDIAYSIIFISTVLLISALFIVFILRIINL